MIFSGVFDLSFWQLVGVALVLTHITIASVTIFLHRCQAHRALELGPIPSHFFRFWLWLTTGMVTKQWAAIHRKHHAKCETEEDPHSPQILGINAVLWGGVLLYVKESRVAETMERYGHGTPDDWIERHLYTPHERLGVTLMALIDIALFGLVPGLLVWAVEMVWIPFWAAGVINGLGHFWGYRNFQCKDASTNLIPWGILIGGEELHNNHHAYATSAKLSNRWFEFDIGWVYIRVLEMLGQARVKNVAPTLKMDRDKTDIDLSTLQSVIAHRYLVLTEYAQALADMTRAELEKIKSSKPDQFDFVQRVTHCLLQTEFRPLTDSEQSAVGVAIGKSPILHTIHAMRLELIEIWSNAALSREQLVARLQAWCREAESSGIAGLQRFSKMLRCYA